MEFTAFDWNPGMIEFPVPLETRKIIIYTEERAELLLCIKIDQQASIILDPGINSLCLCNLFKNPMLRSYTENTLFLIYKEPVQSKIILYELESDQHTVIILIQYFNFRPKLEYLSKVSLLKSGIIFFNHTTEKSLPVPVRQFFAQSFYHQGHFESFRFSKNEEKSLNPPENLGEYIRIQIEACTDELHQQAKHQKIYYFVQTRPPRLLSLRYLYQN
jgi:hypothetical protein